MNKNNKLIAYLIAPLIWIPFLWIAITIADSDSSSIATDIIMITLGVAPPCVSIGMIVLAVRQKSISIYRAVWQFLMLLPVYIIAFIIYFFFGFALLGFD